MITDISTPALLLSFLPAAIVIIILLPVKSLSKTALYATARMLVQLIIVGYLLVYIFDTDSWLVVAGILMLMLIAAAWIAIRTLETRDTSAFLQALFSIAVGSISTLGLITQCVVEIDPWFSPRYVVPLAGMIFAASMNAISLAAERFEAETSRGEDHLDAKQLALQASLIPVINSLFAVGIVTLPGMMTGQILSGVSPIVAAKYQIVVMSMLFGATGISAAIYLALQPKKPA